MLPMPDPAAFLERLEDLYRKSAKKPAMLLLSFPHNPTTQCVDLDFFKEIIRLAAHHGTMVVHDFAYADLGFDGYKPPSILQVDGAKEVAVEIFSLSKSYNMAGWRVGFCLGNAQHDSRPGPHQELSGLRRISAHSDRLHHRAAGMRGGHQEDLRGVSEAARRADSGTESRGLAGGAAQGDHVRVGPAAGEIQTRWDRSSFRSCCWSRPWWPSLRESDSARWAKGTFVSR